MSFDDPFAGVEETPESPQKRPKRTKTGRFDQPMSITRREAYKATGTGKSAMHGRYYQLTTRLPLEVVDELRAWAGDLNMSQQDVQRYCIYRGLQALTQGERPEVEEVVIQKRLKRPD